MSGGFRPYIHAYIACFGLWWPPGRACGGLGELTRLWLVLRATSPTAPVALRATDAGSLINTLNSGIMSVAATLLVRAAAAAAI